MRSLSVFNSVSIDGFFTDDASDMSWAHRQDAEWAKFMSTNASGEAELVFGRKTYEMMARFWPSKEAAQAMPEVARGMNRMRKTVFSHTLKAADWENSRIAQGRPRHRNPPDEKRRQVRTCSSSAAGRSLRSLHRPALSMRTNSSSCPSCSAADARCSKVSLANRGSSVRRRRRFPTATSSVGMNYDVPAGTFFARRVCCSSTSMARP